MLQKLVFTEYNATLVNLMAKQTLFVLRQAENS